MQSVSEKEFPVELLVHIGTFCDKKTRGTLSCVSHQWQDAIEEVGIQEKQKVVNIANNALQEMMESLSGIKNIPNEVSVHLASYWDPFTRKIMSKVSNSFSIGMLYLSTDPKIQLEDQEAFAAFRQRCLGQGGAIYGLPPYYNEIEIYKNMADMFSPLHAQVMQNPRYLPFKTAQEAADHLKWESDQAERVANFHRQSGLVKDRKTKKTSKSKVDPGTRKTVQYLLRPPANTNRSDIIDLDLYNPYQKRIETRCIKLDYGNNLYSVLRWDESGKPQALRSEENIDDLIERQIQLIHERR